MRRLHHQAMGRHITAVRSMLCLGLQRRSTWWVDPHVQPSFVVALAWHSKAVCIAECSQVAGSWDSRWIRLRIARAEVHRGTTRVCARVETRVETERSKMKGQQAGRACLLRHRDRVVMTVAIKENGGGRPGPAESYGHLSCWLSLGIGRSGSCISTDSQLTGALADRHSVRVVLLNASRCDRESKSEE